jgi:hypothetical protein
MNLRRFNEFARELNEDPSLRSFVQALEIARRFHGVWYRDDGSKIDDEALVHNLEFTATLQAPWRRTNEYRAFFPVDELDSVITGLFPTKPSRSTRQKVQQQISSCLKRCSDSYRARHDELTQLLNRAAFDATFTEKLRQFKTRSPEPSKETRKSDWPTVR